MARLLGLVPLLLATVFASPAVADVSAQDQAATDFAFMNVHDRKHDVYLGAYSEGTELTKVEKSLLRGAELLSYDLTIDRDAQIPHLRITLKVANVTTRTRSLHQRYGLDFGETGGLNVEVSRTISQVHVFKAEELGDTCHRAAVRVRPKANILAIRVPLSCLGRTNISAATIMPDTEFVVLRDKQAIGFSVDQGRTTRELPLTPATS
ncbi:hypothetical protein [Nocardioides panaciterrulae]|uniref:Uncharacterized protein n=1 Tax=Nocardioides panaciterrulae TaxID=661492 RepID=A0A7Y9E5Y0_9ACTN|nr:hypothetical protein [Nocardioides panaciterrulae]NYD41537.1 hypothetical protein [Nocardioides panaciterrulae]